MKTGAVFSVRVRQIVLAVGIISFLATVVVFLWGGLLVEPEPMQRDSYGRGVLGHRALVEALDEMGFSVTRLRRGRYREVHPPVLFIEPAVKVAQVGQVRYALDRVLKTRGEAGLSSVVVLPKWEPLGRSLTNDRVEAASHSSVEAVLRAAFPDAATLPTIIRLGTATGESTPTVVEGSLGRFTVDLPHIQGLVAPAGVEVLLGTAAAALVIEVPSTGVVVVADPDLVHNWNVQRGQNANVLAALIRNRLSTETIFVDEVFHGHGRELSLGEALGSFPAVLLTAHGLVLALLFVVAGMSRFGPPREAPEPYERGPREVIDTAAVVLGAGQPAGRLVADYVEHVLLDLTVRLGIHDAGDAKGRATVIDKVARRRGEPEEATRLLELAWALNVGGKAKGKKVGEALRVARRAHLLRARLLREGGRPPTARRSST